MFFFLVFLSILQVNLQVAFVSFFEIQIPCTTSILLCLKKPKTSQVSNNSLYHKAFIAIEDRQVVPS